MPAPEHRAGPLPCGSDPESFDKLRRRVLWSLPAGLYLLGSVADGRRNLMTCSFVSQLATEPKLVGVGVESGALSAELIRAGRCFALALLDREDRPLVRKFVKPAVDDRPACTLNGVPYRDAATGAPVPLAAIAHLDCRLEREVPLGSHALFVGEVVDAGGPAGEGRFPVLRIEDTRMSYGG